MRTLIIISFLLISSTSFAETLSEPELLYRCYAHLTNKRLKRNHPLLKAVKNKSLSAADACVAILDRAALKPDGMLKYSKSVESKAVLNAMTKLHMTFFEKQSLTGVTTSRTLVLNDIYDEQSLALHYTKALFVEDSGVDKILIGKKDLEGVRSLGRGSVRGPSSGYNATDFKSLVRVGGKSVARPWSVTFAQSGELLGLRNSRVLNGTRPLGKSKAGADILNSFGGGVLGARAYTHRISLTANVNFDGALKMNRPWANNVLKDFLCRELPAVRLADGQPYKRQNAEAPFRKADGCVRCHATMDQLAAGGRGLSIVNVSTGSFSRTNPNFRHPSLRAVSKPAQATHWPVKSDKEYHLRPAHGALYFRSYDGELINKKFTSFESLGQKILETKDFYACVAKKYYRHFTGVDASLADINDPFSSVALNEQELFHRNQVIALGEELQRTKDSKALIKSILQSSTYKKRGYTSLGEQ